MINIFKGANNTTFKTAYVECECCCNNHVLRFMTTEQDDCIYVDVILNPKLRNFFKRLYMGLKYAFNSEICDYECGLIEKKDVDRVVGILNGMKDIMKDKEE